MEITVGIDVSKKRLDVYVHPDGTVFSLGNDEAGHAAAVERLRALSVDCIGLKQPAATRSWQQRPLRKPGCRWW